MRTYGRGPDGKWVVIEDEDGAIIASLIQTLRMQPDESPFFADLGIPIDESLAKQIAPDIFMARIQAWFAPHFSMLTISNSKNSDTLNYNIQAVTKNGRLVNQHFPA